MEQMQQNTGVMFRLDSFSRSGKLHWGRVARFRQSCEPGNPQATLPPEVDVKIWTYRETETVTVPCSRIVRAVGTAEFHRHLQEEKNKLPDRYVCLVGWVHEG